MSAFGVVLRSLAEPNSLLGGHGPDSCQELRFHRLVDGIAHLAKVHADILALGVDHVHPHEAQPDLGIAAHGIRCRTNDPFLIFR